MSTTPKSDSEAHSFLEASIRKLQEEKETSKIESPPEKKLQEIIREITESIIPKLLACAQMQTILLLPTITEATAAVLSDKEKLEGISEKGKSFSQLLRLLQKSPLGHELLLRIVHSISSIVHELHFQPNTALKDIHQATMMLAARPLFERLTQEELI